MTGLDDIWFGKYHYEVAILPRNFLLTNSLLTISEAWHNFTERNLGSLEKVDESVLCKIFETPSSTPREILYLPIRFIKKRSIRLNLLKYILSEPNYTKKVKKKHRTETIAFNYHIKEKKTDDLKVKKLDNCSWEMTEYL